MKRIAVLTSGGDAPGMNATIRAVVRTACAKNVEVLGIRKGFKGLMNGDMFDMDMRSVSDILQRGGTVLYSARSPEFKTEEGLNNAVNVCRNNGIEGIVVIGGDGSFRGARDLSLRGIPCVGVTGTIDNDIACCDYTTGYDTALNTIVQMVDRLRDTCESHDRCSVVEVMGRSAGYLALNSGIAVGAMAILIPEVDFDIEKNVIERIKYSQQLKKNHFIVVAAEGVSEKFGGVEALAKRIEEETGVESRYTVLGHVQRGGSPTLKDRVVGSRMGNYAAHLLMKGVGNRVVTIQHDDISDMDIYEAVNMKKSIDLDLYRIAMEISI